MATLEGKQIKSNGVVKEGNNLLGSPTFQPLDNGRFKCIETGHELPAKAQDSYSRSKRCRIGLIDFALTHSKPPLNMFKQKPLNSSKLICKLTGDTINKSEEHIWKHINGKRFFNKLEQLEADKLSGNGDVEMKGEKHGKGGLKAKNNGAEKKKDRKKMKEKNMKKEEIISEIRDSPIDTDSEELEFWIPPEGERWDFDDGGDRWGSDSESDDQHEEHGGKGIVNEEEHNMSAELS